MDAVLENLPIFVSGFVGTLVLSFWGAIGALLWGTALAALRVSPVSTLRAFGTVYVNLVRNTPLTLVMFFTAFGLPILQITFPGSASRQYQIYAILALVLYTSCFVCETIRSGILAIPVGQAEAGRALGLTFGQNLGLVVLPQALRSVVGPLGGQIIALVKNTSIASAFNGHELISAMRSIIEIRGDEVVAILAATALAYMVITLPLGGLVNWIDRKAAFSR